ncbi:MAG: NifB/NifX family molybdenum-iron cluster-binding protein [Thermoanaerobaculia bacterium]|jgi:predicted Fe-Mo cluster-binding NifX family protein|nr:NifB/NifX family molybdenum-iron cluster-binding protein [Thermoanaerobaculia bacterium]
MNLCIPVTADRGLESPVSGHFGSAPLYLLVDSETRATRALSNARAVHEHGACRPLDALAGETIDALVVGGIGAGALAKLRGAGIRVFRATAPTASACLDAFLRSEVEEIDPAGACAGHGHDHGRHGAGHASGLPTRS